MVIYFTILNNAIPLSIKGLMSRGCAVTPFALCLHLQPIFYLAVCFFIFGISGDFKISGSIAVPNYGKFSEMVKSFFEVLDLYLHYGKERKIQFRGTIKGIDKNTCSRRIPGIF
jgi:hypothetical protein